MFATNEGFYVTNNLSTKFKKSELNSAIIEHFTLTDIDYKYANLYIELFSKFSKIIISIIKHNKLN